MIGSTITTNLRSKISKKEVKLHDIQPTELIGSSGTGKVCLVCTTNVSSYCCPQCFIPYCSSQCYLKHGIECTETFSRQRVKGILDLEKKSNVTDTAVVVEPASSFSNYSDSDENEYSQSQSLSLSQRKGIISTDDYTNNDDLTEYEEENNGQEDDYGEYYNDNDDHSDTENGNNIQNLEKIQEKIQKMPPRVLARLVKLWTPWWTGNKNTDLDIEVSGSIQSKKRGITSTISRIKHTAPRLNTLIKTDKLTKDVGYQILGLLLGYVVAMHSLNGDWQENIPPQGSAKNVLSGPIEALKLICLSTPSLDSTFRPTSVIETIGSWIRFRPYTLQNISRKKLKSILLDTFSILKYSEFLSFALLEIWFIASSCQKNVNIDKENNENNYDDNSNILNTEEDIFKENREKNNDNKSGSHEFSTVTKCAMENLEKEDINNFSDNALTLLDLYVEKFQKKAPIISTKKSKKSGTSIYNKNDENYLELIQADLLARKSYFLLLFSFDENRKNIFENLAQELKEYLTDYIED